MIRVKLEGFNEDIRHRIALGLVWFGWAGGFTLIVISSLYSTLARPAWMGLTAIFLLGVAIAASAALGRMRLQATISEVFSAGIMVRSELTDAASEKEEEKT